MNLRDLTREQIAEMQAVCRASLKTARTRWGKETPAQDKVWELAFSRGLEAGLAQKTTHAGPPMSAENFPNVAP